MIFTSRFQSAVLAAALIFSTSPVQAEDISQATRRRIIAAGYSAGVVCNVWTNRISEDEGTKLIVGHLKPVDVPYFRDIRVQDGVNAIATDIKTHNNCKSFPKGPARDAFSKRNADVLLRLMLVSENEY